MRKEPTNEASSFSFRGKLLLGIIFLSIIIPTVGGYYLVRETTNSLKDVIFTKSVAFTTTLARQIKPALEFDDNETAKEISDAITLNSFIRGVRVWKLDIFESEKKPTLFTESFDSNQNQSFKFKAPTRNSKEKEIWSDSDLIIERAVYSQNQKIGVVQIVRSLDELEEIQGDFERLAISIWLILILLVFLAAIWLEKSLTKPLRELVLVAEKISSGNNLLFRAKKLSNDEFGKLTAVFNKMLDSIRETNEKLINSNLEMESRVLKRTADLKSANDKLKSEIDKRISKNQQLLQLQNQLGKQERLASVGQVSSNIAHELRNPMAAIRNSVYFLRSSPIDTEKSLKHLDIIDQQLSESDEVIQRLLESTKGKKLNLTEVNLNKLCRQSLAVLDFSDHIKYSFKTTTHKATILADKILFRQLLLNLFQNSIQAMELASDAYIQVSLRQEHNGIEIQFADNGPGIPKEIQNRIFEPLYTSKNEGFGLGLTLCAQIVARHKGSIEIKESSKEGTTFIIRLPNLKHI